jgi:hypothetical protein
MALTRLLDDYWLTTVSHLFRQVHKGEQLRRDFHALASNICLGESHLRSPQSVEESCIQLI